MKQSLLLSLAIVLVWAILGALAAGSRGAAAAGGEAPSAVGGEAREAAPPTENPAEPAAADGELTVTVCVGGTDRRMALNEYLTGVLLAELPGSFHEEAFKAQAVASRTYVLRASEHPKHGAAAVCTDSACCQAWVDPGTVPAADRERAEAAVRATDGMVLRSGGELIEATFFSCSGGRTEAAAAVWGRDLPYLQAVDSPGEEGASHFLDETRVPLTEFCTLLRQEDPKTVFTAGPGGWVGEISYTPGGGVDRIELGGRSFTGKALRKLFGLRSTAFTLELTASEAVFTTRGFGHRVGMSQWGAEAMARGGKGYAEILTHYYRGVSVEPYS